MGDLERIPEIGESVALPGTGEVVDLSDGQSCVRALSALRDFEQQVIDAKRMLTAAIVRHSENIGSLTFRLEDGTKVEVTSRPDVIYDAEQLEEDLRLAGMSEERISEIVKEEVTHKVVAREAKKAAAANEQYADALERARTEIPKPPSVTIRRL